ncbi:hypothetical protein GCM10027586_01220 [Kineococcus gypseus]
MSKDEPPINRLARWLGLGTSAGKVFIVVIGALAIAAVVVLRLST